MKSVKESAAEGGGGVYTQSLPLPPSVLQLILAFRSQSAVDLQQEYQ